jgi:ABC-2 type transport system permease protein
MKFAGAAKFHRKSGGSVVSIYGMVWVATRIYHVGILMYGMRPTLPEMLRWLKYS